MSKTLLRHTFTKNIFDIVNHVYQILREISTNAVSKCVYEQTTVPITLG